MTDLELTEMVACARIVLEQIGLNVQTADEDKERFGDITRVFSDSVMMLAASPTTEALEIFRARTERIVFALDKDAKLALANYVEIPFVVDHIVALSKKSHEELLKHAAISVAEGREEIADELAEQEDLAISHLKEAGRSGPVLGKKDLDNFLSQVSEKGAKTLIVGGICCNKGMDITYVDGLLDIDCAGCGKHRAHIKVSGAEAIINDIDGHAVN